MLAISAQGGRLHHLYNSHMGVPEGYSRSRDLLDLEMSSRLREAKKAIIAFKDRMRELDIQYVVKVCDEGGSLEPDKATLNVLIDSSRMTLTTALVFLEQERGWLLEKLGGAEG